MAESEVTEAAQRKAEELDVDLSQVEGTGAEGRIKVTDVEKASETPAKPPVPATRFKVKLNPKLPRGSDAWIVNGRRFKGGEIVSSEQWEELSTVRYTDPLDGSSCQVLLKGGEA